MRVAIFFSKSAQLRTHSVPPCQQSMHGRLASGRRESVWAPPRSSALEVETASKSGAGGCERGVDVLWLRFDVPGASLLNYCSESEEDTRSVAAASSGDWRSRRRLRYGRHHLFCRSPNRRTSGLVGDCPTWLPERSSARDRAVTAARSTRFCFVFLYDLEQSDRWPIQ